MIHAGIPHQHKALILAVKTFSDFIQIGLISTICAVLLLIQHFKPEAVVKSFLYTGKF